MKSSEVIRAAMLEAGLTQKAMATKLGKGQTAISNALNRPNGIRVDIFVEMLNAAGYEVIVRRGKEEMVVTE